jgi:hypothetical protein
VAARTIAAAALFPALVTLASPPASGEPEFRSLALRDELKPAAGARYGDLWASGSRILLTTFSAAAGASDGLYVLDAARPDSLTLLAHLPTTAPPRDVTAVDSLCLLVFEPGFPEPPHPATLLVSIADPSWPRVLSAFRSEEVTQVHNGWLAPPFAYLACSSTGDLRILDVTDPAAPREAAHWSTGSFPRYLHDVVVRDTLAFLCYWEDGLRVLSVSDPTRPYEVGRYSYAAARAHAVALSRDGATAYLTDEIFSPPFGAVHVLDVSDLSAIREVGAWRCPAADASAHNVVVFGDRLAVSHYQCGVHLLDISDPREPVEIGAADVDSAGPGLTGFWGVAAPANGGDLLYASHLDRGAFVFEARPFRAITVGPPGAAEFASIQDAMDAARAGDTVRVATGVFRESVRMKSGVRLEGGGAEATVIDAAGTGRPLVISDANEGTAVARLSIAGGLDADGRGGGGILLERSTALIESVAARSNRTNGDGGGILIEGGAVTLHAVRCIANRARGGGGAAFREAAADGGAIGARGPATKGLYLADCALTDNVADDDGGGLLIEGAAPIEAVRVRIARNQAHRGGAVAARGAPRVALANALLAWNRADVAGGALFGEESHFVVESGVIADNAAPDGSALAGGAVGVGADLHATAVVANRGGAALSGGDLSSVGALFCDFFGNDPPLASGTIAPPGPTAGNLFADPLFTAPTWEALDYLPRAGSPLIDAGDPSPEMADLDGTRRDIGLGGGPRSGWVAPRLGHGLRAEADDNYAVAVRWDPPYGATHAIYRSAAEPVPIDPAHRVGQGVFEFRDATLTPDDTLVYYRGVPEDAEGHAGSPSDAASVRPTNRPPRLDLDLSAEVDEGGTIDSVALYIYGSEQIAELDARIDGEPVRIATRFSHSAVAQTALRSGSVSFVVRATDVHGAAGADSLVGSLAYVRRGHPRTVADGSDAIRIALPALHNDALFFIAEVPAPSLPNGQIPISGGYSVSDIRFRDGIDSVDVSLRGPPDVRGDEAIVLARFLSESYAARRDLSGGYRTSRLPANAILRSTLVLAATAFGTPVPQEIEVFYPRPNPFRTSTRLQLDLDRRVEEIVVDVYDMTGRRVRTLFRGGLPRGFFSVEWDGRDDEGRDVPSGSYILRGDAQGRSVARRATLIR